MKNLKIVFYVIVLFSASKIYSMAISNALKMFRIVKHNERIILERFGKFHKVLSPGLHFTVPLADLAKEDSWSDYHSPKYSDGTYRLKHIDKVNLRETVYDYPPQYVITQDNVMMEINAILYYKITDPYSALYEVSNLPEALEKLTQTTLRNVIGSMTLDITLTSREEINNKLKHVLDEATKKWGVHVTRVELQAIVPPENILKSMEKQMEAERIRRAMILEAEGVKQSAILKAEAKKQEEILNAEGLSTARKKLAQAESENIELIKKIMPEDVNPAAYIIARDYIKTLPEVAEGKNGKLLIIPTDAIPGMGLMATVNQLLTNKK